MVLMWPCRSASSALRLRLLLAAVGRTDSTKSRPLSTALCGRSRTRPSTSLHGTQDAFAQTSIFRAATPREHRHAQARAGHVNAPLRFCQSTTAPVRNSSTSTASQIGITHTLTELSPDHHIATIILSNPRKLNIVTTPLLDELQETFNILSTHPTLRAVILTGGPTPSPKPPSFIGGADITEMHALSTPYQAKHFIQNIHSVCTAIRHFPVPIIARIHGLCLGAGLEIAAACDLRIASSNSTFGMPEVAVGIPSVVEAALLPGLIGTGRTRRLVYLAETIDAVEAERWGLVEKVIEGGEEELDRAVGEWTERIAGMGPKAMREQKKLCLGWERASGVEEGIEMGVDAFGRMWEDGGTEPREFMGRFVNRKRK